MELNPRAKAKAGRTAIAKSKKIRQLGITPDMSQEEIDAVIVNLSTAKALIEGKTIQDYISGQEWYVNDLVAFSSLTAAERFQQEYDRAFVDEAEVDDIEALIAAQM